VDAAQRRIEVHPALVALPLEVPVGPLGLLDRGVPEMILDPSEVGPRLEGRPRRQDREPRRLRAAGVWTRDRSIRAQSSPVTERPPERDQPGDQR
jgi:hypothetical protein